MSNKRLKTIHSDDSDSDSYDSDYFKGPADEVLQDMRDLLKRDEKWHEKGKKGKRPLTYDKMRYLMSKHNSRKGYRCHVAWAHLRHIKRQKKRKELGKLAEDEEISESGSDHDYCSSVGSVEVDSIYSDLTEWEMDQTSDIGEDEYSFNRILKEETFEELLEWMKKTCEEKIDMNMIKPAMRDTPLP